MHAHFRAVSTMTTTVSNEFFIILQRLRQYGVQRLRQFSTSTVCMDVQTFYHRDLQIKLASKGQRKPLPDKNEQLGFCKYYTDHMLEVDFDGKAWSKPVIHPYCNFSIDPAAKVFHYAPELFEGMKAYRGDDNRIRMFRPELNMARMRRSAIRSALPDFDGNELIECMKELLRLDHKWVPHQKGASLYIRPTMIGTEPSLMVDYSCTAKLYIIAAQAGAYFDSFKPISLLANPKFIRAAEGGVGAFKMGCNYAPTMQLNEEAKRKGCHQVLWLAEREHYVTEAGAMNFFVYWKNEQGEDELITASLESGLILPGVTRQSILEIAREMSGFKVTERNFTMDELRKAVKENRVYEMFGAGTAVVVSPVSMILYDADGKEEKLQIPALDGAKSVMQKVFKTITDIQYGRATRPQWTVEI